MKFSTKTLAEIRQLLVGEFSEQLQAGEIQPNEIEQNLRSVLQAAGQESLGAMLSLLDEHTYQRRETCLCQGRGQRIARCQAQLLSVFGWVAYRRSYYQCEQCGRRWKPLDHRQQLRPGRATQTMAGLLGLAGVTVSFEEARAQVRQYLQVEVGVNTIRQETQLLGNKQAHREQMWIEQGHDPAYLQSRERQAERPLRWYGSIDGAFVPVEQEWKETKTVSWYRVGPRYGSTDLHALDVAYYTSLDDAAAFGQLLWGTAVRHQADRALELVFVCDGAAWIWKLIDHYFPDAVQIVDWYHACHYLYPVGEALFDTEEAQNTWVTAMKEFLWEGQVANIIQTCQTQLKRGGDPAQRLITYYTNNQARLQYDHFRAQGYFIGSGTVESACKQIVTMRLKRSGAQWSHSGAMATAKARTAWLSGSWDSLVNLPLAA
jgi:hypothetical protein